jgi:hypothetical protein
MALVFMAATNAIPEKYNLDSQLEKVSEISKYNFMSWQTLDSQSFVLQTGPSDYYLIVLAYPAYNLPFTENISIPVTNALLKPGFNSVVIKVNGSTETYIINNFYKKLMK